jgi:hypothetical protein
MTPEEVALVISAIALLVSLGSLWVTALSPFAVRVFNSTPVLTIYGVTSAHAPSADLPERFIPSIDFSVTLHNTGRRPGVVKSLRLRMSIESPSGIRQEVFQPVWVVNYAKFHRANDRFERLDEATELEWYDVLLPGGSSHRSAYRLRVGRPSHVDANVRVDAPDD